MFKVLVTTTCPGDAQEILSRQFEVIPGQYEPIPPAELLGRLEGCDAVVSSLGDRFGADVIARLPNLKLIANVAVGYDNIDVGAASGHGVLVLNTPGVLTDTTADLAFALLLATARRLVESDRYVRENRWLGWEPDLLLGTDVHHKTLGIIGFGRIGQAVARRALGFNMQVLYAGQGTDPVAFEGARMVSLEELLGQSDFISLHTPLSKDTHHLIGERELSLIKPGCVLINTARGAIIDQQALIRALSQGRLHGAGLDVFENEPEVPEQLKRMQNVVLLPHVGSASVETRSAMAALAVDGLMKAFFGERPANAVNPEVWPRFRDRFQQTLEGTAKPL